MATNSIYKKHYINAHTFQEKNEKKKIKRGAHKLTHTYKEINFFFLQISKIYILRK